MLGIILGLLKIIGIILLVLLITLILLVSIVLLVPIRYSAKGHLGDDEKTATATITWLCKIIRVKLDYRHPDKPILQLKVLWIDIMRMLEKKKEAGKPKKIKVPKELKQIKKQRPKKEKVKKEPKKKEKYHPAVNIALLEAADAEAAEKEARQKAEEKKAETKEPEKKEEENASAEKLSFEEKIEKILFKISNLYDKIMDIMDKAEYYIGIYEEKETQSLIKDSWKSVCKILKSIRPRVFRLKAILGFDSPETTGKVYGYYCMAMPWLGDDIILEPVFEEKTMDIRLQLKGHIRLLTILINGLRIALDKRLKRLIHKLKNGGNKNG